MIGSPTGNVAQAEKLENPLRVPAHVRRVSVGARCLSAEARVQVLLVQDHEGTPSDRVLGEGYLSIVHNPAKVHEIECDIAVPPGNFWIMFKACDPSAAYTSIHGAVDDIAPCRVVFAESYDGGVNWEVRESPSGPGLAVRIEAIADQQPA
jgi:hypothetical protein